MTQMWLYLFTVVKKWREISGTHIGKFSRRNIATKFPTILLWKNENLVKKISEWLELEFHYSNIVFFPRNSSQNSENSSKYVFYKDFFSILLFLREIISNIFNMLEYIIYLNMCFIITIFSICKKLFLNIENIGNSSKFDIEYSLFTWKSSKMSFSSISTWNLWMYLNFHLTLKFTTRLTMEFQFKVYWKNGPRASPLLWHSSERGHSSE